MRSWAHRTVVRRCSSADQLFLGSAWSRVVLFDLLTGDGRTPAGHQVRHRLDASGDRMPTAAVGAITCGVRGGR